MPPLPQIQVGLIQEVADACYQPITQPSDVLPHLTALAQCDREQFVCLHLDARNRPRGMEVVSIGSLSASIVHPREVFKAALLSNAAAVLFAHNHPSGDPSPSADDIALTRRLQQAGALLGIDVLDHLIICPNSAFRSLKEEGLMSLVRN
jgi:DNA repair protein RadC